MGIHILMQYFVSGKAYMPFKATHEHGDVVDEQDDVVYVQDDVISVGDDALIEQASMTDGMDDIKDQDGA